MRKILLASIVAIAAAAATIAPAGAHVFSGGGSYFGFGPFGDFYDSYGPYPFYGPYWGGPYYDNSDRGYGNDGGYVAPPYRAHCRLERVSHWRHHHRVVERARVCG